MPVGPELAPPVPGDFAHAGAYGTDNFVTQASGAPVAAGTPATVYMPGGTTLATLYGDRNRSAPAANPVPLGPLGNLRFYADPGDYDVVVDGTRLAITVNPYPLDTLEAGVTPPGGGIDPDAVAAMLTGTAQDPISIVYRDVTSGGDGTLVVSLRELTSADVDASIATVNTDGSVNGTDGTGIPLAGTLATHAFVNRAADVVMVMRDRRYAVANSIQLALTAETPTNLAFTPSTVLGRGPTGAARLVAWSELGAGGGGLAPEASGNWHLGAGAVHLNTGTNTNEVYPGVVTEAAGFQVNASYTLTGTDSSNEVATGSAFVAHIDQILNNPKTVLGTGPIGYGASPPLPNRFKGSGNPGFSFPSAMFEAEGTIQYQVNSSGYGGAGVGFQAMPLIKNKAGLDRSISGYQPFLSVPFYMADGEDIVFAALTGESSLDGVVGIHQGFCDWPVFGSDHVNGGTLSAIAGVSYVAQATYGEGAIGDIRWGFQFYDAQTNLNPLLNGSGDPDPLAGNILNFDSYGSLGKQVAVAIPHLIGAVANIGIHNGSTTVYAPMPSGAGTIVSLSPSTVIPVGATQIDVQVASGAVGSAMVTTANPQIAGGFEDGQIITITNLDTSQRSVVFGNGRGLLLPASNNLVLRPSQSADFRWWAAGSLWIAKGRSQGGFVDTGPVAGGGALKVVDGGSNSLQLAIYGADGDTNPKVALGTLLGGPVLQFGPGGATFPDTTLGRAAAGVLSSAAWSTSGLTGSTTGSRWVGGTASGAPASGAHAIGDWSTAQDGRIWVCVFGGTPGTWVEVGANPAGNISMTSGANIILSTTTGTKIGTATNQLLGFYNATPIARQASANQAAAPAGGTGATAGAYDTAAHRDALIALVNEMRSVLVNLGLMKGSA